MAGDLSGSDFSKPISGINVTPFVDVMLVLLVIFMVTAPAMFKDVMKIRLPKSQTTDTKAPTSVGIVVTEGGQILFDGKPLDEISLQNKVRELLAQNDKAQAIVAADAKSRHEDVVRAIDLIRKAGLERFALQIDRED